MPYISNTAFQEFEDDAFSIGNQVFYRQVVKKDYSKTDDLIGSQEYNFDVPSPFWDVVNGVTTINYDLDRFIKKTRINHVEPNPTIVQRNRDYTVKKQSFTLHDNRAAVGRLLSTATYNREGQILGKTSNSYRNFNTTSNLQGIEQETFSSYKIFQSYRWDFDQWPGDNDFFDLGSEYWLLSSSRITYPNVLEKSVSTREFSESVEFVKHDFLSGQTTETLSTLSSGTQVKSVSVPAYSEYSTMGSKLTNSINKNMLTQSRAQYTLLDDNGVWKPVGVGITTWKNEWEYFNDFGIGGSPSDPALKIWRKHKTYLWDGEIDQNGFLDGYDLNTDDNFNWTVPQVGQTITQPEPWKEVAEISLYDHNSMQLEVKDVNGNQATSKLTDDGSKILLSSNAGYGEVFYTGAEYDQSSGGNNVLESQIFGSVYRTSEKAHTGDYSLKLNPSSDFKWRLKGGTYKEGKYKISIWAHKDNHTNVRFKDPGGIILPFNGEKTFAGDWVQMNHYFDRNAQTELDKDVRIVSINGDIFIDDFRFHPVESSMTSYVYNKWDELVAVLGSNNLATHYVYDEAGRLTKVFAEVVDRTTVTGGFKRIQDYIYNYKRGNEDDVQQNDDPCTTPLGGTINSEIGFLQNPPNSCIDDQDPTCNYCKEYRLTASPNGGCGGTKSYTWQFRQREPGGTYQDWSSLITTDTPNFAQSYDVRNSTFCGTWVEFRCKIVEGNLAPYYTAATNEHYEQCTSCGVE